MRKGKENMIFHSTALLVLPFRQRRPFFFGGSSYPSSLGQTRLRSLGGLPEVALTVLEPTSGIFDGAIARLVPERPKQLIAAQTSTTALFHSSPPLDASPHHVRVIMTRGNPFFPNLFSFFQSILVAGLVKFGCPSSAAPQTRASGCRADHHDHQASAKVSLFSMGISIHVRRLFIQTPISVGRLSIMGGKFVPVVWQRIQW